MIKRVKMWNTNKIVVPLPPRWIAYSHVDFSGNQYVLEKGFYNNCADWGSKDTRICSVQPILPVSTTEHHFNTDPSVYWHFGANFFIVLVFRLQDLQVQRARVR